MSREERIREKGEGIDKGTIMSVMGSLKLKGEKKCSWPCWRMGGRHMGKV